MTYLTLVIAISIRVFLGAWGVWVSWNYIMPKIFGLIEITYWEGMALVLLVGFLFFLVSGLKE